MLTSGIPRRQYICRTSRPNKRTRGVTFCRGYEVFFGNFWKLRIMELGKPEETAEFNRCCHLIESDLQMEHIALKTIWNFG